MVAAVEKVDSSARQGRAERDRVVVAIGDQRFDVQHRDRVRRRVEDQPVGAGPQIGGNARLAANQRDGIGASAAGYGVGDTEGEIPS